jgi:hypothetical protein
MAQVRFFMIPGIFEDTYKYRQFGSIGIKRALPVYRATLVLHPDHLLA